ncbi:MAG TPA: ribonuclease P protein component [Armatimonadota bacterium]|nr:ribonuclease P protein component [Armatimonadota bacterium]
MRASEIYAPLRKRADFRRVHQQGRRKSDGLLQVRVAAQPPGIAAGGLIRLGMLVTKKYGSAVERNRFKRLVRAAIRALGPEFTPGWDILVLPREAHQARMADVEASLRALLGLLGVMRREQAGEVGES